MNFHEGDLVEYHSPDVARYVRTVRVLAIGTNNDGERILQVGWPEGGRWAGAVAEVNCKPVTETMEQVLAR